MYFHAVTNQAGATAAVTVGPDGRAVVVKTAGGPRADRLRHEAKVLAAAAHPGVVEVVALAEGPDGGADAHHRLRRHGGHGSPPGPGRGGPAAGRRGRDAGRPPRPGSRPRPAHPRPRPRRPRRGGRALWVRGRRSPRHHRRPGARRRRGRAGRPGRRACSATTPGRRRVWCARSSPGCGPTIPRPVRRCGPLPHALAPPAGPPAAGPRLLVARRTPRPAPGRPPARGHRRTGRRRRRSSPRGWPGPSSRATAPATPSRPGRQRPPPTTTDTGHDHAADDGRGRSARPWPWPRRSTWTATAATRRWTSTAPPSHWPGSRGRSGVPATWPPSATGTATGAPPRRCCARTTARSGSTAPGARARSQCRSEPWPGAIALRAADPDADGCESLLLQRDDGTTTVVDAPG